MEASVWMLDFVGESREVEVVEVVEAGWVEAW